MAASAAQLLGRLQDKYGTNSVMMAGEMPKRPAIKSGSLALDFATGIGGFPSDRVVEIAGAEGTGKTTLGLLAMANFLDADPSRGAVILDTEHKLDSDWVRTVIGEQRESRVVIMYPDSAEQATNMYVAAVGGDTKLKIPPGQVGFVMFDSIGGSPTARRNEDYETASFGGNSLAITEFARVAAGHSHKYNCLTVGINQIRADMSGYNRHLVPGGHGWLHACSLRLQLKRGKGKVTDKVNGEEFPVGYEILCKVIKNGLAAPGRVASWWFYNVPTERYGFGVDTLEEVVRLGTLTGVIERRGGWYYHSLLPWDKDDHRILGRDRLIDYVRDQPAVCKELSAEITARLASHGAQVAPISDPDAPIEESHFPKLMEKDEFDD